MKWRFLFVLVLVAALVPGAAHAEPGPASRDETRWYGWQILLVDLALITATAVTFAHEELPPEATALPLLAYVVGAPIVHGANEQGRSAALSAALRLVPAALGGLTRTGMRDDSCVSVQMDGTRDTYGCIGHGLLLLGGMILTAGAAIAVTSVDAGLLSDKRTPDAKRISLGLAPGPHGATMQVGGTF